MSEAKPIDEWAPGDLMRRRASIDVPFGDSDWVIFRKSGLRLGQVRLDWSDWHYTGGQVVNVMVTSENTLYKEVPVVDVLCKLGPQPWEDGGLSFGLAWNESVGGALWAMPVERGRHIRETRNFDIWVHPQPNCGRFRGATAVVDEICFPDDFLDCFEAHYEPNLVENLVIWEDERWEQPHFEYYGENFFTLDAFEHVLDDLAGCLGDGPLSRLETVQAAWPQALQLLGRTLEVARALNRVSGKSYGIIVAGP